MTPPHRLSAAENIELRRFKEQNMDLIAPFIENSRSVSKQMGLQPDAILGDTPPAIDLSDLRAQWTELKERAAKHFGAADGKADRMIGQMESETRSLLDAAVAEGAKPRPKETIYPPPYMTGYTGR